MKTSFLKAVAVFSAMCIGVSCLCGCGKNEESSNENSHESEFAQNYNETKVKGTYYVNTQGVALSKDFYISLLDGFEPNTIATMGKDMIYAYEGAETIESTYTYGEDEVFYSSIYADFTQNEYKKLCTALEPNIIDNLTGEMAKELKALESLDDASANTEGCTIIDLADGKKLMVYTEKFELDVKKPDRVITLNATNARTVTGYELSDGKLTRLENQAFEITSDSVTFRNANIEGAETLYEIGVACILE